MLVPGNPMCYVNQEFCRVTGYDKGEVSGRNCRFLQGPRTEPQSVAVIQDTLRRGVDCHVRITNYRKSGELFQNLLTMRPVHDTNGVYRFCIGVQFEVVDNDPTIKSRLTRLSKMIQLLPKVIEVSSKAANVAHVRSEAQAELATSLEDKLSSAFAGQKEVHTKEAMLTDGAFFANHHADQLAYVDKVSGDGKGGARPQSAAPKKGFFGFGTSPPKVAPSFSS